MFPWFLTLYTYCSVLWKLLSHLSPPSLAWNLREAFRGGDHSQNKSFFKLILSGFVQSGWHRKTGTRTVEWSLCLDLATIACRIVSWEKFWKVRKYKLENAISRELSGRFWRECKPRVLTELCAVQASRVGFCWDWAGPRSCCILVYFVLPLSWNFEWAWFQRLICSGNFRIAWHCCGCYWLLLARFTVRIGRKLMQEFIKVPSWPEKQRLLSCSQK